MRPTKLIMNAFGPYKEKVELDFTKFGSSSIFLVTGPTGAGKTTIFDAITYALFNQSSGDMRKPEMLKSQFATDEEECYVELTFELGTEEYRVRRRPKQKGPGARKGSIQLPASAELYKGKQPIATSITEVNQRIADLIGLSFEQFCQIVMLPQGDFQELLQSSSNDKEVIFRSIFGTEPIEQFKNRLKEKRSELKKEFTEFETRLKQSVNTLEESENEELQLAIQQMDYEKTLEILNDLKTKGQVALKEMGHAIDQLTEKENNEKMFKKLLEDLTELEKTKQELDANQPEIEKKQEMVHLHKKAAEVAKEHAILEKNIQTVEETKEDLIKNKEKLLQNEQTFESLQEKETNSKNEVKTLNSIRKNIQKLEEALKKFAEVAKKKEELTTLESELVVIQKKIMENEEQKLHYDNKIKDLNEKIVKLDVWKEDLIAEEKKETILKENLENLNKEMEKLEKLINSQKELTHLLEEEKKAKDAQESSDSVYQKARASYFGNLAGILAMELKEELPCPVCGSIHHPNPALSHVDEMTEEKLAELEDIRNQKQSAYVKISTAVEQLGRSIKDQTDKLNEKTNTHENALEQNKKQATTINKQLKACEETILDLKANIDNEKNWRSSLEEQREQREENALEHTKKQLDEKNRMERMKQLKAEIKELTSTLAYDSKEGVQEKVKDEKETIQRIEKEAEEISKKVTENQVEKATLKSIITTLSDQQKTNIKVVEEQKEIKENLIKSYGFEESFNTYLLTQEQESEMLQAINAFNNKEVIYSDKWKDASKRWETTQDNRTITEVEKELETIAQKKKERAEKREQILIQNRDYEMSYKQIEQNYTASKAILDPLQVYTDLSEIADGSTSRTSYVSFERYVLSIYLEEVLSAANKRFETMTNGRFEMIRREDRTKGRAAEGLEIDVFDRHSGKTRSVRTLSGGETFKASLALALGLSDVIQNEQGGVHVDTLFVDEGFGTLDADSLEMAIETLIDLQSTGRLIGIISHVEELKDRIPARIIVENKKQGSHSRIEVD